MVKGTMQKHASNTYHRKPRINAPIGKLKIAVSIYAIFHLIQRTAPASSDIIKCKISLPLNMFDFMCVCIYIYFYKV